jgi:hypothetical protein
MGRKTQETPSRPITSPQARGRFNRLAVTAFILSCVGWFGTWLPGLVLGFLALEEIDDSEGERGRGLAKWAIGLGLLGAILFVLFVIRVAERYD